MKKKALVLFLAAVTAVSMMSACGSSEKKEETKTEAADSKTEDKAEEKAEEVKEEAEEAAADAKEAVEEKAEDAKEAVEEKAEDAKEAATEAAGDAKEAAEEAAGDVKEAAEDAAEKVADAAEEVKEDAAEAVGAAEDAVEEATEEVADAAEEATEEVADAAEEVKEDAAEAVGAAEEAVEDAAEEVEEAADGAAEEVKDAAEGAAEAVEGAAEDAADKAEEGAEEAVEEAAEGAEEAAEGAEEAADAEAETEEAAEEAEEAPAAVGSGYASVIYPSIVEYKGASYNEAAPDWTEYTKLIAEIKSETDMETRVAKMHEAEDILMGTAAVIPIYYYNDTYLQKADVEGIYSNLFGFKFFQFATCPRDVLKVNLASEPAKVDPALNSSVDGACLAVNMFAGLYTYDADGNLVPDLADPENPYEVSDDGLVYTFHLQDGLKWSDGTPVTAKDFEYAWKRCADPQTGADYAYMFDCFALNDDGSLNVEATDDLTLVATLNAPCAYFLDLCAFPAYLPVPQAQVEAAADWETNPGAWAAEAGFVTNGAYTMDSWNHEESIVLKKNPNYHRADEVSIEEIDFMLSADDTAIYAAYQSDDLDFADSVPTNEVQSLLDDPEFHIIDNLGTYYAAFNVNSPIFEGKTVDQAIAMRKAFAILIDRAYIVENVGQTGQKIATSYIPAGMADGNGGIFKENSDSYKFPNEEFEGYYPEYPDGVEDEAIEEAIALLEYAGFEFEDGVLSDATPLSITYLTNENTGHIAVAEAMQQDFAEIGIDMSIESREWNVFLDERKDGQFDFAREGWIADFNDPINMLEMWTPQSGNNDCQFGKDPAAKAAEAEEAEEEETTEEAATEETTEEAAAEETAEEAAEAVEETTDAAAEAVEETADAAAEAVAEGAEEVAAAAEEVADAAEETVDAAAEAAGEAADAAEETVDAAAEAAGEAADAAEETADAAAEVAAAEVAAAAEEAVGEVAGEVADAAEETIGKGAGIVAKAGTAAAAVAAVASEAADGVKDAVKDAAATVQDKAEAVVETAKDTIEDAKDKLADAAKGTADKVADAAKDTVASVVGSATEAADQAEEAVEAAAEEEEEFEDTGVAPETPGEVYEPACDLENPKDQAILVVSFGTSYNENRGETICAVENAIAAAYPEYDVRRAFTAQIIIDKVLKRDNVIIDNVEQALDRCIEGGVKKLIVVPTHLMDGFEYSDVFATISEYADAFDGVWMAAPLLDTDKDFEKVADIITAGTAEYDDGETAIVFMGHGTEAESNAVYAKMQDVLKAAGKDNYFIGTVEATPSLEDVLALVGAGNYKKVVLEPLMVVAGDHANNDMGSDEEDSWKTAFTNAGYDVTVILKGLGSFEDIQAMYVENTAEAIEACDALAEIA